MGVSGIGCYLEAVHKTEGWLKLKTGRIVRRVTRMGPLMQRLEPDG